MSSKDTVIQYFEWYLPADASLWRTIDQNADKLEKNGFTMLWMPPAYKGSNGINDVGYGVYDLYDLGEFDQKGTIPTKYGTKDEYLSAIKSLQSHHISAIADIVLNHRMGSDGTETIQASVVNPSNRNEDISAPKDVDVWTKFSFPNRHGKYSDFEWNWKDFTGTDFDEKTNTSEILQFQGKEWNENVSKEQGNFDYIMGADVDFNNPNVIKELYNWGRWYTEFTGVNGFRLDAIKSIDADFFTGWLNAMSLFGNHPNFAVGEYWTGNLDELLNYLKESKYCMTLFDVPLHFRLQQASKANGNFDLQDLFNDTLTQKQPDYACAFVDNHDTQPGQALESWVENWFKLHAYAFILLRECKYPCVFYGDYYGIVHDNIPPVPGIKEMVWIRNNLLGDDIHLFNNEDQQSACWVTAGKSPVAVLMSIGDAKEQEIQDEFLAGKVLVNMLNPEQKVQASQDGKVLLSTPAGTCTVYILQEEYDRMKQAVDSL